MAINVSRQGGDPNLRLSEKIDRVDKLFAAAAKGKTAADVLSILDPILEQRLGVLLDGFRQSSPELGCLLDWRAKICEVWNMRQTLKQMANEGKSAELTLEGLMETALQRGQTTVSGNRTE